MKLILPLASLAGALALLLNGCAANGLSFL
jgi:hypothetical protein